MVKESPPLNFRIFFMLNYEKRSLESEFSRTFDHQKKFMELWLSSPLPQKKVKSTPMVAW